jgi:multisubunit Na+/H+ antiporter MnhB subunit
MSSSGLYGGIVLVIFAIFMFVFMLHSREMFRPFGDPIITMGAGYLKSSPEKLHTANAVTATVLDFRGYDTLGEATIIFAAIVGVLVLLRPKGRIDE